MTALLTASIPPAPRTHDRFNTAACLAVGAAISAYCVAEPAPLLAAFALPVLTLGWWLARDGSPPLLPRVAINVLVLAAIARAFLLVGGSTDPVVSHLSEFLVLIQLIKLFDRRLPRDEAQFLSLSLFIVIGALLTSNSLGVGLLLLVYTPLATGAMMLLQIRSGLTRARNFGAADDDGPRPAFAADLARPGPRARAARRHFLGVVSAAIFLSFISAFVIFLLTPRGLGQDRFGRLGQRRGDAVIGFNDQVNLGAVTSLGQDATPVMDVRVTDERGRPLGSNARALHLRGAVLDAYDPEQRTWRPGGGRRYGGGNYTLAPGRPFFLWRQRLRFGVMHRHAAMPGLLALYGNELHGLIGILPAPTVEVPQGSPLRSLELGAPLLGICGEDLEGVLGGAPFLPFRTLAG